MPSAPIDPAAFALAMQAFAPFESHPTVAVAVSGGPDSVALLLLTDRWARERGGAVVALTVDHGLRPDSAAEAAQVAAWAQAWAIEHAILPWTGAKPLSGIQAAARQARYALLAEACAARGILHLAVAHHADDQAETILFRRERGSGPAGLAGMAASRSLGGARMIRPLLGWPKSALIETCRHFDQAFVEDPSNRSDCFARAPLRRRLAADRPLRASLLAEAEAAATLRSDYDRRVAEALSQIAEMRPDGVLLIDREAFALSHPRRAALGAALRTVGGNPFAPDADAVERLDASIAGGAFPGASLAGCVVRPWRNRLLLCREPRRIAAARSIEEGVWQRWDGRFLVRMEHMPANEPLTIGALGSQDYAKVRRGLGCPLPAIAGAGLPAVRSSGRLVSIPSLGWGENDFPIVELRYSPLWPLASETFTVVSAGTDIMSV
jgi:tRNA(Ile)-lysidine synthase